MSWKEVILVTSAARSIASPHVLFVNTRDGSGADVAVHAMLARYLAHLGARATFTLNRSSRESVKLQSSLQQPPSVGTFRCTFGWPVREDHTGWKRAFTLLANATALPAVLKLVLFSLHQRVDVCHATDRPREALLCVLVAGITRRKSVVHMHSNYHAGFNRLSRWAMAHCTCVIGVSGFTASSLESAGIPRDRLAVVHNAVNTDHFHPAGAPLGWARRRWGIPSTAPLIGLVGRLIPYKGHEDLLKALAHRDGALGDAHVLIVGNTGGEYAPYVGALKESASALGLGERVHFTGFQADVRPIYRDIDVLAVPSWDEPFGLVITEALAMEVPVVAYRAGGVPEIITSGREGLLVTRRDSVALGKALESLLQDGGLRARMGMAGRHRVVMDFNPERQAREILAVYRRLLCADRSETVCPA